MTPTPIGDFHVAPTDLPWKVLREGYHFKLLRTCPVTGTWVALFRTVAGASVPSHKHIGAAEYFVLKGKIEIRGGAERGGITASAGDYGYEPNGIIHEQTYFPEPCEYLFINHGPLQYLDAEGNTAMVLDWMGVQAKWDEAPVAE
ncbi:2,4'-dihydroxyacetophenone dioxygenase family protein [Denitromonas ohlonensis]|uniref:Cupin domain-containing protein n=2 Tax=Denitromonas TaxID=139331 RepID=A0A558E9Q6_9RHOO|nr:2,4'-dihydroxyacetophenone dioxygenase family protein [Denitromonas ohlonensis]TVO64774.1 cupin domain-containing protein [Denitromonas ohlonensis]TVO70379.1 cupin domain-containing protein [Denitromonas ohlonensis]TVT69950.1 MAG: cupin domain-containing protein [Denitromonas halophila]